MRIVLMFFLLMLYNAFICEGADLKFHTLSPKDGLSFDGVIDIKQDGHGFIWILLDNNLFRFDGYSYKSYKANFVNGKDTTNYYFNNMAVNSEGRLHVATSKGGYIVLTAVQTILHHYITSCRTIFYRQPRYYLVY